MILIIIFSCFQSRTRLKLSINISNGKEPTSLTFFQLVQSNFLESMQLVGADS